MKQSENSKTNNVLSGRHRNRYAFLSLGVSVAIGVNPVKNRLSLGLKPLSFQRFRGVLPVLPWQTNSIFITL